MRMRRGLQIAVSAFLGGAACTLAAPPPIAPYNGARVLDGVRAGAQAALISAAATASPSSQSKTYRLNDGSVVLLGADGFGVHEDAKGGGRRPLWIPIPAGRTAFSDGAWPAPLLVQAAVSRLGRGEAADSVIVVLASATAAPSSAAHPRGSSPLTTDARIDAALRVSGARSIAALFPGQAPLAGAATAANRFDMSRVYLVSLVGADPIAAARRLRTVPGIAYAVPNWKVSPMHVGPHPLPPSQANSGVAAHTPRVAAAPPSLPSNFGVASSLQSYLNANGVNALSAYAEITRRYGQIPGTGTIITNVSLGDLTDEGMADAGDSYVQIVGPTTVLRGGRRYLDFPSLPLIPTYSVDMNGVVDPRGAVEGVDPYLGEVLLDFSVMAPLPHDRQRPQALGQGALDLLGIAPGAKYRLVVPKTPTFANILVAMMAAAHQSPAPDVITASLGYGFDGFGFPGRYFEDDPLNFAVVQSIVQSGIVVTISANDGMRLYTNAAIGADGGAAPTNLLPAGAQPTSVADDGQTTIASLVPDSGAVAVGGSTLDDIFSAPPQWSGPLSGAGAFPETRLNGGTYYASGFGTRVNVSAPSDNIAVMAHVCINYPCRAQDAAPVLEGGTSASAPMVAAAAAVLRQVARLSGADLTPAQVRGLLSSSGRPLPNPPQVDRPIAVGPQLDLGAAVDALLAARGLAPPAAQVVRIGVAQRQNVGDLGASFMEATDPAAIDLTGPADLLGNPSGQNNVALITLAPDIVGRGGLAPAELGYRWTIGRKVIELRGAPSLRLLPEQLLADAGFTLASSHSRQVPVTFEVLRSGHTLASSSLVLTFSASTGTYEESLAPKLPSRVPVGAPLRVHYDLTRISDLNAPQLVLSSINHWNPVTGPLFRAAWTAPLTAPSGDVEIPASAFAGGAGIYGVGILVDSTNNVWGEFSAVQVTADNAGGAGPAAPSRPAAPLLAATGSPLFGHALALSRASPRFEVRWDVRNVPGASGALLEISAPAPTIRGLYSTFTNPNGSQRDNDGADAPSLRTVPLPGTSGTTSLDALALNLPTSMFYTVRVLASNGNEVAGQASPVSSMAFDDGLPPGGGEVTDFDVNASGPSTVAVAQYDSSVFPPVEIGSAVFDYTPASASYGAPLVADTTGALDYHAGGSDLLLQHTLVIGLANITNDEYLDVYDKGGVLLAQTHLDVSKDPYLLGARVDSARHRAALLGWASADYSDLILPLDLQSGVLGSAIPADVNAPAHGLFTAMDLDAHTGKVFPATSTFYDQCFILGGSSYVTSVDLDAGSALPVMPGLDTCSNSIAADQKGGALHTTIGPELSFPFLFPPARTQVVGEQSLTISHDLNIGGRSAMFPVVDPVHDLLLVDFLAVENYLTDNNATSAVGVYDLRAGRLVKTLPQFNLRNALFSNNYFNHSARGLQIDPATRRGWTYGPGNAQIQQFTY